MPKPKDTLDRVNVNTPCEADWNEMVGNDQVRFCQHCNLSVHNLSAMTRKGAIRLVARSGGKLCIRFYRRPDNKIETVASAARQLHQLTRRASRLAAGTFTAALSLGSSAVAAMPASNLTPLDEARVSTRYAVRTPTLVSGDSAFSGTVTDANGAVVAGAGAVLTSPGGTQRTTTTDEMGKFNFGSLEAGTYSLEISSPGFSAKLLDSVSIQSGADLLLDVQLDVAYTSGAMSVELPSDPLVAAVLREEEDAVKALLATGAPIDVIDDVVNSTALAQAVNLGNIEIVRMLLAAGADPNIKNNEDKTAIMYLDDDSEPELVDLLFRAGARLDVKDKEGKTSLMILAESNTAEVIRAMINAGASVNVQDKNGQTALMRAAYFEHPANVEVLLRAGADVNVRNKLGETALGLALEEECEEAINLLQAYGAVP